MSEFIPENPELEEIKDEEIPLDDSSLDAEAPSDTAPEDVSAEDEVEPSEASSPEEEPDEEPKKGRIPAKTRINSLSREKYALAAALKEKDEKLALLEKRLAETENAAMHHYDKAVKMQLDDAEKKLQRAIEDSDSKAFVEAQKEIAEATYKIQESKRFDFQKQQDIEAQKYQAERQQRESQAYYEADESLIHQWVTENPWFDAESDAFDPELAEQVKSRAIELDQSLIDRGQQHLIGSRAYFDTVNKMAQQVAQEVGYNPYAPRQRQQSQQRQQQNPNLRRPLTMAKARTPVASVNSGTSGRSEPMTQDTALDSEEKQWIRYLKRAVPNITEKSYVKNKREAQRQQQINQQTWGYR